jgi:hypothetical protein
VLDLVDRLAPVRVRERALPTSPVVLVCKMYSARAHTRRWRLQIIRQNSEIIRLVLTLILQRGFGWTRADGEGPEGGWGRVDSVWSFGREELETCQHPDRPS